MLNEVSNDAIGEILMADGWHKVRSVRGQVVAWPPFGETPILEVTFADGSTAVLRDAAVLGVRARKDAEVLIDRGPTLAVTQDPVSALLGPAATFLDPESFGRPGFDASNRSGAA